MQPTTSATRPYYSNDDSCWQLWTRPLLLPYKWPLDQWERGAGLGGSGFKKKEKCRKERRELCFVSLRGTFRAQKRGGKRAAGGVSVNKKRRAEERSKFLRKECGLRIREGKMREKLELFFFKREEGYHC